MATELQQMIDVLAKDKGIEPGIVVGAIMASLRHRTVPDGEGPFAGAGDPPRGGIENRDLGQ